MSNELESWIHQHSNFLIILIESDEFNEFLKSKGKGIVSINTEAQAKTKNAETPSELKAKTKDSETPSELQVKTKNSESKAIAPPIDDKNDAYKTLCTLISNKKGYIDAAIIFNSMSKTSKIFISLRQHKEPVANFVQRLWPNKFIVDYAKEDNGNVSKEKYIWMVDSNAEIGDHVEIEG
jgi:23S rRNA pseudoU1915 N3-methylase RlmH